MVKTYFVVLVIFQGLAYTIEALAMKLIRKQLVASIAAFNTSQIGSVWKTGIFGIITNGKSYSSSWSGNRLVSWRPG